LDVIRLQHAFKTVNTTQTVHGEFSV